MRFVIPEHAVSHFHLREGDAVGDFGAGAGYFTKALSQAVGGTGVVYAFEIQKQLTEKLADLARTEHLSNVEIVWGDIEAQSGCKIPDGRLDAGVLVNALFQMEDKEAALREIARLIRPGGKLFVLDWSESFSGMGPQPGDVLTPDAARTLAEGAGFTFERDFPAGEHHYGLAFRRT